MTGEEKKTRLKEHISIDCLYRECTECNLRNPNDSNPDEYFCILRDSENRVPFQEGWDMDSAMQDD